jgi:2-methylcitrate dehydratase PrpD
MGKLLEKTVQELVKRQQLKRSADQVQYHVNKEYTQTFEQVFAMLRAGHKMPDKSKYFADVVEEPKGCVSNAYIVQRIEENYPKLAHVIEQYRKDCREELVERLKYGVKAQ